MYQAKLFENEQTTAVGHRQYGSSQHFHYVFTGTTHPKSYDGARMVHSTLMEMLANVSEHAPRQNRGTAVESIACSTDAPQETHA